MHEDRVDHCDIHWAGKNGEQHRTTFEVEDLSPSVSPETDSVEDDDGGPHLYQFEQLAHTPVMPKAGALSAEVAQELESQSEW